PRGLPKTAATFSSQRCSKYCPSSSGQCRGVGTSNRCRRSRFQITGHRRARAGQCRRIRPADHLLLRRGRSYRVVGIPARSFLSTTGYPRKITAPQVPHSVRHLREPAPANTFIAPLLESLPTAAAPPVLWHPDDADTAAPKAQVLSPTQKPRPRALVRKHSAIDAQCARSEMPAATAPGGVAGWRQHRHHVPEVPRG